MKEDFILYLREGLKTMGLPDDPEKAEKLYAYYRLMEEKNKVMNLTAITGEKEVILKHFLDSLAVCRLEETRAMMEDPETKLIDVGTGAGLPGIPLRIFYEAPEMVLFDSLQKRLRFLDEVIEALGLKRIRTLHGRAEDIGHMKEHREAYRLVVSRAVAPMPVLLEFCLPLCAGDGLFLAYKGAAAEEELAQSGRALKTLGGALVCCRKVTLPGAEDAAERSIAVFKRSGPTPGKYPRKAGTPAKSPL